MEGQEFFDELMAIIFKYKEKYGEPVIVGHLEAAKGAILYAAFREHEEKTENENPD